MLSPVGDVSVTSRSFLGIETKSGRPAVKCLRAIVSTHVATWCWTAVWWDLYVKGSTARTAPHINITSIFMLTLLTVSGVLSVNKRIYRTLLIKTLDGGEWSVSRPGSAFTPRERTPGTHWTGGWVGPRAGLDTEARGKILCPRRGFNPIVNKLVFSFLLQNNKSEHLHVWAQLTASQCIIPVTLIWFRTLNFFAYWIPLIFFLYFFNIRLLWLFYHSF
jgi:hypothetical protein